MSRPWLFALGIAALAAAWGWPLPAFGVPPFSLHMAQHMIVVAIAAPLLALGIAGGPLDPAVRAPAVFSPIPASMVEMVVVWAWHAPAMHHLARHSTLGLLAEQATFLLAGVALWISVVGGGEALRRARAFAGVTGLLLTFMHMTLLGALVALTPRDLYGHHGHHPLPSLADQQIGGAVMLFVSGVVYLGGALALVSDAWLRRLSRRSAVSRRA
ncbi:MAG: cytochrome c oxidase assembly protein [Deltaproteobacteria bacterium]|nr:cytochrome c oxidase assembly protein [Deltaproteobacteria bacterium]